MRRRVRSRADQFTSIQRSVKNVVSQMPLIEALPRVLAESRLLPSYERPEQYGYFRPDFSPIYDCFCFALYVVHLVVVEPSC